MHTETAWAELRSHPFRKAFDDLAEFQNLLLCLPTGYHHQLVVDYAGEHKDDMEYFIACHMHPVGGV